MTKLGSIEFDDCILDALRDEKLVIFAGAGVSMGPPSNLASFWKLTCDIAQGTGFTPTEPLDRFLGQLAHRKVAVHERAAQLLSPAGSAPNALHYDLLRLFRSLSRVRLVTTNFDVHFETAANALFGDSPTVYRAPALPLGYDFTGIVHVHGALPQSRDLVLTDADFGRAYLTEGWARRFLVDVFRRYTVLFVGYSHTDVVLNYLARALPAGGVAGRFAFTEEGGNWELLGIRPIRFRKTAEPTAFKELYDGVQQLADRANRGALDWQTRLTELGGRAPPADEEAISEVEQALREVHTARFLTNVARDPEWLRWLNARKYLDALFESGDLGERDKLLAAWVAEQFAIEHPTALFEIVAAHALRMNPVFWWAVGRELAVMKEKKLDDPALTRWVTVLLASAPARSDHHVLMWLAERCAAQGLVQLTAKLFLAMGEHRLNLKPSFAWSVERDEREDALSAECVLRADHWSLNEVWTKELRPHLPEIGQEVLSGVARHLEDMHYAFRAWGRASPDWDPTSYGRSAIEPHEQDKYPEPVDALIDAARDALESLGGNTVLLDAWSERLVSSEVPLLRRLAVHVTALHPGRSADERLSWLLERVGLHRSNEFHEVHRAVAANYAAASDALRRAVIDAVLAYSLPATEDWPAEKRTARFRFDWLSWLLNAKPDCPFAAAALEPIKAEFPDWRPSDYPDFAHWVGSAEWVGSESPWPVEQLLARTPGGQLDDLLTFQGTRYDGPDREGLLAAVRETCKQAPAWASDLLEAMSARALWSSDLWAALITGWQVSNQTVDGWRKLLNAVARPELLTAQSAAIANLLYALVRDDGRPFATDLLEDANAISMALWNAIQADAKEDDIDDWLSRAINRPAGVLAEFWINGLSLLMHGKTGANRAMPENYRQWFTTVLHDPTSKGGMARSILASQTAFLFGLDEGWTRQEIIPLFIDSDSRKFAQAWDGFLVWGRLYPALVEALMPAFLAAPERLAIGRLSARRKRFIEFYTAAAVFHVADPMKQLLPSLFQHGTLEDRDTFASHLGYVLRQMQPAPAQQIWANWLRRYWQDRMQGILAPLEEAEMRTMLDWIPHLGDAFPEAVSLAVGFPKIGLEHSHLVLALRQSDLVTRFPNETTELLIYLCGYSVGYQGAELRKVAERLPPVSPELRLRLDEAMARAGL